jgi:hypothetical protein
VNIDLIGRMIDMHAFFFRICDGETDGTFPFGMLFGETNGALPDECSSKATSRFPVLDAPHSTEK